MQNKEQKLYTSTWIMEADRLPVGFVHRDRFFNKIRYENTKKTCSKK